MLQGSSRFIFLALVIILIVIPVISQETNFHLDMTLTASVSETASATPSPSATASETQISPTPSLEQSPSPSPTATSSIEEAPSLTETPVEETATAEFTASPFPTTTALELTEELNTLTETATSEILPTATIGAIPMQILLGSVQYQNREDHSGIQIRIFTEDDSLLSEAQSNSEGIFSIAVPAEQNFIALIEAPLHRAIRVLAEPKIGLPPFVLAGGDLDGDGCINFADMDRLMTDFDSANSPETDINADGLSNSSDLAILAGNLESACEMFEESSQAVE